MKNLSIKTILNPPSESLDPVNQGLHEFNLKHLGEDVIYHCFKIAVIAKDSNAKVIAGIHGDLVWEWLYINTLWVDEKYRNQGIGSSLLKEIEVAAVSKGFLGCHLETTDFQAVDFYQKNGYEIFGKLAGKPTGRTWFFMKKILATH